MDRVSDALELISGPGFVQRALTSSACRGQPQSPGNQTHGHSRHSLQHPPPFTGEEREQEAWGGRGRQAKAKQRLFWVNLNSRLCFHLRILYSCPCSELIHEFLLIILSRLNSYNEGKLYCKAHYSNISLPSNLTARERSQEWKCLSSPKARRRVWARPSAGPRCTLIPSGLRRPAPACRDSAAANQKPGDEEARNHGWGRHSNRVRNGECRKGKEGLP